MCSRMCYDVNGLDGKIGSFLIHFFNAEEFNLAYLNLIKNFEIFCENFLGKFLLFFIIKVKLFYLP